MASAGRRRNYKKTMIQSKIKQLLNAAVREITTGRLKNANLVTKIKFLKKEKEINIAEAMNQTSDGSVGIILTKTDLKPWDDKIEELTTQRREEIAAQLVGAAPDSEATAAAARKKAKKARKREREKTKKRMMSGAEPPGGWLLPPLGEGENDELERFTMKLKKDLESGGGGESKGGRRKRTRKRKRRRTKKRKSRKRKRRSKRRKN